MKYLCLVYFEPQALSALSADDDAALTRESLAYDQELDRRGQLILAHALQPVSSATTVRVRNGKLSTFDGPFAETKEILGGFVLIEARDLNEAIRAASGIPLARLGSIEIRPIMDL
ncbi:MAG TPA: YciI family protein [Rhizobiaceae bacterium]|nr:YciI family protein [Rhizobiaceae bacterium]